MMRMILGRFKQFLLLFVILALAALPALVAPSHAEDPVPAASPSPGLETEFLTLPAFDVERAQSPLDHVKVGDSFTLRVQGLTVPGTDSKLETAPGTDNLTDSGWELSVLTQAPAPAGELWVKATPLKAGKLTLPSLAVKNAEGKSFARTNPFQIDVDSAIKADDPKPEESVDLRPPVSLRFPWWVIVAGVLLLVALGYGGYVAAKRYRARTRKPLPVAPAEPPKPEDEVALAALEALQREGALQRGDFKKHYFKLSEILKTYLGARYRFDAVESTTSEMIRALESKRTLGDQQVDRLESIFDQLDRVKFTDHVPLPDEGQRLLEAGRELVRTTRRPPAIIATPAGGPPATSGEGPLL